MKKMKFRIYNPDHSVAIQKKLFELGYFWNKGSEKVEFTHANGIYTFSDGIISFTYREIDEVKDHEFETTTLDELYEIPIKIRVKLNSKHTAIVNKKTKTVIVGCQEFAFDAIEELYKVCKS